MQDETKREEEMLRNPICVRWRDQDYKLVTDTSWERRVRVSVLIRDIVLDALRRGREASDKVG